MQLASNPNDRPLKLGVITHGSLNGGVEMKLGEGESIEDVVAGTFVVIQGQQYDFFSMITDVEIDAANEAILLHPPGEDDELLRRVMQGLGTYTTVALKPMLMMENRAHQELADAAPRSVKTVPAHFSRVARATDDDVTRVFGHEAQDDGRTYFHIGEPLGMEAIPVCINLDRLVERSNAVFGKTGTGKTFLTRLLLSGTIKTGKAVNLVFDMHSEYGLGDRQEGGAFVKGLRDLFPHKVSLFSLDPKSTRQRAGGAPADCEVYLYADQIAPADILPLQATLNLNATAAESSFLLQKRFKKRWLNELLARGEQDLDALAEEVGAHPGSLAALRRKLAPYEQYDFFRTEPSAGKTDVLDDLLENLDAGKSVVFEFGRHDDLRVYLLVANVITRRIRERYEEKTNRYRQTKDEADRPHPLIITIEEAHKFLTPGIAHETPFGKIAREMRKYFVSLLVVDQRPSAIDEEVLSQIGTKIVAQLNDDKDIGAALVGTSDASSLRKVLASLDSKQQALLLGHAVPMPIVVRTRTYDDAFYQAMKGDAKTFEERQQEMDRLFG
ncbi:MAG: ATP-binding protein [Rhodothermales bacterium]|nr:ATP-binding protein [Rhodothermales bacterium]